ncbi:rRNA-processing protein UTP23 homolog [Ptychodera flava]|uniref:rRNA-processing protein UTP23 homolog n=1 Tax=Ptychodera flava TaxID=63121 RepID=UPI003969D063
MKIRRYKHARRYLSFYRNNFSFREPHQVLIDGTFCTAALKYKINIREQLPKYLDGEVQLLTTQCCIREAESIGQEAYGAMLILQRFQPRMCGHRNNPVAAADCFLSLVGKNNSNRYFIATQDPELTVKIHRIPGLPVLYINFNAIVLEKPSTKSTEIAEKNVSQKIKPSEQEKETIEKLKKAVGIEEEVKRKKRKRKGGPNPLSCKKKKVKLNPESSKATEGKRKRKRRKRVHVAEHVKEHFGISRTETT